MQKFHFYSNLDIDELLDAKQKEALKSIISKNLSLDDLRAHLEANLDLNDADKKILFKIWKLHGAAILKIIENPVSNITSGI